MPNPEVVAICRAEIKRIYRQEGRHKSVIDAVDSMDVRELMYEAHCLVLNGALEQFGRELRSSLPSSTADVRWLAYRLDDPGNVFILAKNLPDEATAAAEIKQITDGHSKPHGQTYGTTSYTEVTLRAVMNNIGKYEG